MRFGRRSDRLSITFFVNSLVHSVKNPPTFVLPKETELLICGVAGFLEPARNKLCQDTEATYH